MSSTPNALDNSWKAAMNSQPEGSFMFPENVVVEELLEHIDNTWDALWEGQPKGCQPNEKITTQTEEEEASTGTQTSEKKSLWSVVKRVLRLSKKSKKEADIEIADGTQRWGSVIPRFPSGMDWYKGTN